MKVQIAKSRFKRAMGFQSLCVLEEDTGYAVTRMDSGRALMVRVIRISSNLRVHPLCQTPNTADSDLVVSLGWRLELMAGG